MITLDEKVTWFKAASVDAVPENGGIAVLYANTQIALFNFTQRGEWYATDNLCPHKMQMVLSRGMIGSKNGEPKVACPFHKKSFSLQSGECLTGEEYCIKTYPVKVKDGYVYVGIAE